MSLPESERPLDFQTVFMIPNRKRARSCGGACPRVAAADAALAPSAAVYRMPVVGLLIPVTPEEYEKYPEPEDAYFAPLEDVEYEDEPDEEAGEDGREEEALHASDENEPQSMFDFREELGPGEFGVPWDLVPTSEVEEEPAESVEEMVAKMAVDDGRLNLQTGHPMGPSLLKGPPKPGVEYVESWNLPHDAYLCISKDFLYVSTPNAMDSSEELVYKFLKKRRWNVRPDGSLKGNATKLQLTADEVESMRIQEEYIYEKLENQGFMLTAEEVKKAEAEEEARTEAMEQWDKEAMFDEFESEGFD
jgi:hypothetical protein